LSDCSEDGFSSVIQGSRTTEMHFSFSTSRPTNKHTNPLELNADPYPVERPISIEQHRC